MNGKIANKKRRKNSWLVPLMILVLAILYILYLVWQSNYWQVDQDLVDIEDSQPIELAEDLHLPLQEPYQPGPQPIIKQSEAISYDDNEHTPKEGGELREQHIRHEKTNEQVADQPSVETELADVELMEDNKRLNKQAPIEELIILENPYNKIISKPDHDLQHDYSFIKSKLNDYRIFLANSNRMLEKYRAEQDFANELTFFQKYPHPESVNEIIEVFEQYLYLKIELAEQNQIIEDEDSVNFSTFLEKFLKKFIHIKKIPKQQQEIAKLRALIAKKLPILINYLYAEELQDSLIYNNFH